MENPLTLEEKIDVNNLISHDVYSTQNDIYYSAIGSKDISIDVLKAKNRHVTYLLNTIIQMTQYTEKSPFFLENNYKFSESHIPKLFEEKGRIVEWSSNFEDDLITSFESLYALVFNLVNNAVNASRENSSPISVRLEPYEGLPKENLVYVPEYTEISNNFLKIDVHDRGKGFSKEFSFERALELGTTTKNTYGIKRPIFGFGLYFVKLACKFLNSPLAISSEPGNTHVTLYHPTNLETLN